MQTRCIHTFTFERGIPSRIPHRMTTLSHIIYFILRIAAIYTKVKCFVEFIVCVCGGGGGVHSLYHLAFWKFPGNLDIGQPNNVICLTIRHSIECAAHSCARLVCKGCARIAHSPAGTTEPSPTHDLNQRRLKTHLKLTYLFRGHIINT